MTCRSDLRTVTDRGALRRRATAIALAAAFGLAASAPMAAIIDSGPIAYAVPKTSLGLYLNLVTGAFSPSSFVGWDFNPFGSVNLGFFPSTTTGAAVVIVSPNVAAALAAGATIGPASSYQTVGTAQTTGTAFRTTGTEFVGISFTNEATGATNFGYVQIQTTVGNGFPATLRRYVYENTGLPITVATPPPTIIYAYSWSNNHLVSFDAATPGTLISDVPLIGLGVGEVLLSFDFRPANGVLYGITSQASVQRLVTIDKTGSVQPVDPAVTFITAPGNFYGLDFNPVVDRVREVSDLQSSRRINPITGALAGTDTTLAYAAGDPNVGAIPNVVHVAYNNNFAGTATTTLFGIDAGTNSLVMIGGPNGVPSPNTGQLTTIGALGVDGTGFGGFDIHFPVNVAYAALQVAGSSGLYTINLTTGAATFVGTIGSGATIDGLSVPFAFPVPQSAVSRKVHGAATFDLPL